MALFTLSPTLKRTLSNLTWLSADRVIRLFGAVFVNAWVIRHLGPDQNGVLSFAMAFVGMFTPLAVLGMDAIVIRDIVRTPERKDNILGSAFVLRFMGAVLALVLSVALFSVMRPGDGSSRILVVLLASGALFQSFDVIDYWFQSQVQSKYTVYAKNSAFVVASLAKIACILTDASLMAFAAISAGEFVLSAIGLVVMFRRQKNDVRQWTFTGSQAKALLVNSWPIVISDLAVFMQSRIDQVMIGQYLSTADVGYYAAAQKVSEPLSFIPMVIMSSVYPVIVQTKEWSETEFSRRMTNLYRLMFIFSIVVCLPVSVLSKPIISILYGDKFAPSALILALVIWTRFYAFYGVARSVFISSENLFRHALVCSVAGVLVNVSANYFLIPRIGILGSIVSAHLGFLTTIFIIDGFSTATRNNFKSMLLGVFTFHRVKIN